MYCKGRLSTNSKCWMYLILAMLVAVAGGRGAAMKVAVGGVSAGTAIRTGR
jgi:hypothetical protein